MSNMLDFQLICFDSIADHLKESPVYMRRNIWNYIIDVCPAMQAFRIVISSLNTKDCIRGSLILVSTPQNDLLDSGTPSHSNPKN